jgi:hypothetical protein
VPRGAALDATFDRFEFVVERIWGYLNSLTRDLKSGTDIDKGPVLPLDRRLAGWDVGAHISDDAFSNKTAMVALLNFPLTTLDERLKQGMGWSRRQWAEARLGQRFSARVPAAVSAEAARAYADADAYISDYNVFMHHVLTPEGQRLFPAGMRLISHWNLRDELKARYTDPQGLAAQRLIATVMDRIVRQQIPAAVVNNPLLDWTPETGAVTVSSVKDAEPPAGASAQASPDREPDTRYRRWLAVFQAERKADPYYPGEATFIDRRFDLQREIPEKEVEALLTAILDAPQGKQVAALIAQRLGRPLEPFDVWYAGFKPRAKYGEAELDAMTRQRYPTAEAYAADMPRLFRDLGFTDEKARFLAAHIVVDPSRGAGHAFPHMRVQGMDYKGYNIAVHEMGHTVEEVFSTTTIDHELLQGVPNNAFTEALAFVFQGRDLQLLGLGGPDPSAQALNTLEDFWGAREIAGSALVDIQAWHWLYAHPEATPAQFREAVVRIAQETWNRWYAPLLGGRDSTLLAIYSHMVSYGMYLPDYPLGHLIAFQVEEHFRQTPGSLGPEFERIARLGSITPDAWMRQAVGGPLSAAPLLAAADRALAATAAR